MTPYEKEAIRRLSEAGAPFQPHHTPVQVLAKTIEELGWKPVDPVVELYATLLDILDMGKAAKNVRDGAGDGHDRCAIAYLREHIPAVAKMMGEG